MPVKHLVRLFVPHPHNNHKPSLLHNSSLFVLLGLFIMFQSAISIYSKLRPGVLGYASAISPTAIVQLTNAQRSAVNLNELKMNDQLNQAALAKATDMFEKGYWAHNAPDGTEPWYFVNSAGYKYLHAGENLARDFSSPETIVTAWMNSPSHKLNLLSPKYQDIGVAVMDGSLNGVETTIVVQMFGTSSQVSPEIKAARTEFVPKAVAEEPIPTIATVKQIAISPFVEKISPYDLSRSVSFSFIIIITLTLAIDWFVVWRRNIVRISGKTWAHLTYMATILLIIFFLKQGLII